MCGICGIVRFEPGDVCAASLMESTDVMQHRGPDGRGFYIEGSVGLGHRRLSIIDLAGGAQPMYNQDGSICVVFNGEIYNFLELKRQLSLLGHRFRTASDTESIIHSYEQYASECVKKLYGMFAFALWDKPRKQLLVARDRLGIKPLYYTCDRKRFIFGSELKSVMMLAGERGEIDLAALVDYLSYGYVPAPKSIYRNVFKLETGHFLVVNADGTVEGPRRYWDVVPQPDESMKEEDALEELDALVKDCVRQHMISDVPLGVFLSGGVDSSGVAAYAAEVADSPINTFSIGFREEPYNELPFARIVAEHIGSHHQEKIVELDSLSIFEYLVHQYDEPFADSSALPTYCVCREASRHVKVCLSGDGGDEVFGGYDRYRWIVNGDWIERIPRPLRRLGLSTLHCFPVTGQVRINGARYLGESFERYASRMMCFHPWMLSEVLSKQARRELRDYDPSCYLRRFYEAYEVDRLTTLQYVDLNTYLTDDILTKVDRASMLNSLEVRVPLLDHRVVEFGMKLPTRLKLGKAGLKHLWRKLVARRVPRAVLEREKSGFAIPLSDWVRGSLHQVIREKLLESSSVENLLNRKFVERLLDEHKRGTGNHGWRIWTLFVLVQWSQTCQ